MLNQDDVVSVARDLWRLHDSESVRLDRIYNYVRGTYGVPDVPEGANEEIKELARLSVNNVLSLVEDTFAQNLSVVGYRRATAEENAAAWRTWQLNAMDARQAEVHRAALRYGAAYVVVTPSPGGVVYRPRSPRQLIAVYRDPQRDRWPVYALEFWVDTSGAKPRRRGALYDSEAVYNVDLGDVPHAGGNSSLTARPDITVLGPGIPHGAPVCPVVRFVNARDAEDTVVGEIEPLITLQRTINAVNFDRLVVARFGAFPQRYIIGWTGTAADTLKAAMSRVWTFEDSKDDISVGSFDAASVAPYNEVLADLYERVAMIAQLSPASITGKMINMSADALAAVDSAKQRKLDEKRSNLGESWEQMLQLGALLDGDPETAVDAEAEVVWRDTEVRSFASVVDGIVKLTSAGIPIDLLLSQIPGLSQQQISAIKQRLAGSQDILAALQRLSEQQTAPQELIAGTEGAEEL